METQLLIRNIPDTTSLLRTTHCSELWRKIDGFEYEVSSFGRIRSTEPMFGFKAGSPVSVYHKGPPYPCVFLYKGDGKTRRQLSVHLLVAAAFLGPRPPGHEVNHKDLNKQNPRLDNLEYMTSSENKLHAVANGAWAIGEKRWNATLTDDLVNRIWDLRRERLKPAQISHQLSLSVSSVCHVVRGRNWKHLRPADWAAIGGS